MSLLINPDYTTQSNQIPNNNTSQQSPIFQATVRPSSVEISPFRKHTIDRSAAQRKRKEITPYIPTNKESSSSSADETEDEEDHLPPQKKQKTDFEKPQQQQPGMRQRMHSIQRKHTIDRSVAPTKKERNHTLYSH